MNQIVYIQPLEHKGAKHIRLDFARDKELFKQLSTIPGFAYTKTHGCYYIPYTKEAYNELQKRVKTEVLNTGLPTTGCAEAKEVSPQNIAIRANNTLPEQTVTVQPDIKTPATTHPVNKHKKIKTEGVIEITDCAENEKYLQVSIPYRDFCVQQIKMVKGRFYSKACTCWMVPNCPESIYQINQFFANSKYKVENRVINLKNYSLNTRAMKNDAIRRQILPHAEDEHSKYVGKYVDALMVQQYSHKTIKCYARNFKIYLKAIQKPPDTVQRTEIYDFLVNYVQKGISESAQNMLINAIKFYYEKVLHYSPMYFELPRPRNPKKLPEILSLGEVRRLFEHIGNLKHKCMLYLGYSAGLRVSEVPRIEIRDIDSERMTIFIRGAKGKKDRVVMLSEKLLEVLREYYKQYKPKKWLFAGQMDMQYSERSLQTLFARAKKKANIYKGVTFHSLRHSFATHLHESGTDIKLIQELLGHADISTTTRYTHVSTRHISKITSPLDKI